MSNHTIKIFTIGFTGKSAEDFFGRLKNAGVTKVIDTRLWASSQLAFFVPAKPNVNATDVCLASIYKVRGISL